MKFEQSTEGFSKAIKWLKDNGHIHGLKHEASTDGHTIVALANTLYEKANRGE